MRRNPARRRSFSGSGLMSSVKAGFSKPLIGTAAGAIGAGLLLPMLYGKVKDASGKSLLPLASDATMGPILYGTVVPLVLGGLLRRRMPNVATGVQLFGVMALINKYVTPSVQNAIAQVSPGTATAGASAYIRGGGLRGIPGVGRLPAPQMHNAVNTFAGMTMPTLPNQWRKS